MSVCSVASQVSSVLGMMSGYAPVEVVDWSYVKSYPVTKATVPRYWNALMREFPFLPQLARSLRKSSHHLEKSIKSILEITHPAENEGK